MNKNNDIIRHVLEANLLMIGTALLFGSVIWTIQLPEDHWLWFSRLALSIISFGLYGIMRAIRIYSSK